MFASSSELTETVINKIFGDLKEQLKWALGYSNTDNYLLCLFQFLSLRSGSIVIGSIERMATFMFP